MSLLGELWLRASFHFVLIAFQELLADFCDGFLVQFLKVLLVRVRLEALMFTFEIISRVTWPRCLPHVLQLRERLFFARETRHDFFRLTLNFDN